MATVLVRKRHAGAATAGWPSPSSRSGSAARRRIRGPVLAFGVAGFVAASLIAALPHAVRALAPRLDVPLLASPSEVSTLVVDRDGHLLRAFTTPEGRWRLPVDEKDVDPRYLAMLLAYEDKRFRTHRGVDLWALGRAASQLVRHGRIVSGGSTLTMQVARLSAPRGGRSFARKLRESFRALALERDLGKAEILRLYLALAPFGGNLEGLRAATLAYFGKEPRRLSHGEAALLVALPQSPEHRRPDRDPEAARLARDRVLARAAAAGLLTAEEAEAARAEPVPSARRPFPVLAAQAAEAARAADPSRLVHRLSIDRRLQDRLEALAMDRVRGLGPKLSAALLVVENGTGEVLAHVGGPAPFDEERAGHLDLAQAVRSPGSTLKPFIYGLAFEEGLAHPATLIEDRATRFGAYAPENFDEEFRGSVTAREALGLSLNVPAVQLLEAVGPHRLAVRLQAAGAALHLPRGEPAGLSVGLGGAGLKLVDLARLYAALARGGEVQPLRYTRAAYEEAPSSGPWLLDPVAAWYVADALSASPPPPNASGGRIAFKTGTSYGYRDAWAIGFDGRHTVAVWIGRPDGSPVPGLLGRTAAAPLLFDAFARIGQRRALLPQPPRGALLVRNDELPPALRRLQPKGGLPVLDTQAGPPFQLAFPPDRTRLDAAGAPLVLRASGGVLPLTWLVDGRPIGRSELRREISWTPSGSGYARISVVDAEGAAQTAHVFVE